MKAQKWGRIVNTASAHSLVASPFKAAYVSAKHGLAGLTKTVALELATFGVTANCISPGYVWTPLVENQIPDTMKARGLTREQVINDVIWSPSRPSNSSPSTRSPRWSSISAPTPPPRSPAPISPSTAAGPRRERGRTGRRPDSQDRQSRPAGRRRARGLHLGRPRLADRGRPSRHRGDQRRQRGSDERGRLRRRIAGRRSAGRARQAPQVLERGQRRRSARRFEAQAARPLARPTGRRAAAVGPVPGRARRIRRPLSPQSVRREPAARPHRPYRRFRRLYAPSRFPASSSPRRMREPAKRGSFGATSSTPTI